MFLFWWLGLSVPEINQMATSYRTAWKKAPRRLIAFVFGHFATNLNMEEHRDRRRHLRVHTCLHLMILMIEPACR